MKTELMKGSIRQAYHLILSGFIVWLFERGIVITYIGSNVWLNTEQQDALIDGYIEDAW